MWRPRVYVDTSVFGGVHDEEFADASRRFFDQVARGTFVLLLSSETSAELDDAPLRVREVLTDVPRKYIESVAVTEEVYALADAYVSAGVVGEDSREDALHVAAASVAGADLLVSWNFRHIVRYDRVRQFNAVNALKGYRILDIRSPLEVSYGREE